MALGPQFENTYWEDDKGKLQASLVNPKGHFSKLDVVHHDITDGSLPSYIANLEGPKPELQGMLFSPQTGTGLKGDPLIPQERRDKAIETGLGFSDMEKYRKRAGMHEKTSRYRSRRNSSIEPISERKANNVKEAYSTALDNSNMPTHIIEQHIVPRPVLPILNADMSRGHISGGIIRLPAYLNQETRIEPAHTKQIPVNPELEAIPNKNWDKQAWKVDWHSEEGARDDLGNVATVFTPEGYPFRMLQDYAYMDKPENALIDRIPIAPSAKIKDRYGRSVLPSDAIQDMRTLPPGYSTNLWIGKKQPAKGQHVETHSIYSTLDRDKTVSAKYKITNADQFQTVEVPEKRITVNKGYWVDPETLIHELGHNFDNVHSGNKLDQRRSLDSGRPDPASEGVADGYADTYEQNVLQKLFTSGETGDKYSKTGYSTKFSGFRNKNDKATYAAVRAHAAAYPEDINNMPSRSKLVTQRHPDIDFEYQLENSQEHRDIGNKLLLGHLYDKHEHVRKTLEGLGLGKAGRAAQQYYLGMNKKTDKQKSWEKQYGSEQLQLPGME